MLEINAPNFMNAVNRLSQAIAYCANARGSQEFLQPATNAAIIELLEAMMPPILSCGAKSAWVSANRLLERIKAYDPTLNMGSLGIGLEDVENRFRDHLIFIKMYIIADDKSSLMSQASGLVSERVLERFVSISFDCEEAAKCLCLGRATASVFHSMRMLEIAIKAWAKRLAIDDPVKTSDRNWGVMLSKIKTKMDELYPRQKRVGDDEGSYFEGIYASLDAVKNPWRNSVMHIDTIYTLEEAEYIFGCTKVLLMKMADGFDEKGNNVQQISLVQAFGHVVPVSTTP